MLLRFFIQKFNIDMSLAQQSDLNAYNTFNEFFIRPIKMELRPIAPGAVIVSPVDGNISQVGHIEDQQLLQAKGTYYSLTQLLAGDSDSIQHFIHGLFITIYLSPRDYHRVHMPYRGQLLRTIYVPGKLFSVNPTTAQAVPGLFAFNERLICLFQTDFGPMAVIFVGAMLVAGIGTRWCKVIAPNPQRTVQIQDYQTQSQIFEKGEEIGFFNFGSTVIVLLPQHAAQWLPTIQAQTAVLLGMPLGNMTTVEQ
jgi:phosphatidylserine decarboxylase